MASLLNVLCLCLLVDGIESACMSGASTCPGSSSVPFDCSSSITTSSGIKHCCCDNMDQFCDRLSDCNAGSAYPDAQCLWENYWVGDSQEFLHAFRYRVHMNGAHNFIDVQVQTTDTVSAYLARGANCAIYATDSEFNGHKLLSDGSPAGWMFDTGDWAADTYCIQLDCNNWVGSCTAEVSASFRECWDVSLPPPSPSPLPTVATATAASAITSPPPDACTTEKAECEASCSGQTMTNTCYISGGVTFAGCTCSSSASSSTPTNDSSEDDSSSPPVAVILPVIIIVALAAVGVVVWRRTSKPVSSITESYNPSVAQPAPAASASTAKHEDEVTTKVDPSAGSVALTPSAPTTSSAPTPSAPPPSQPETSQPETSQPKPQIINISVQQQQAAPQPVMMMQPQPMMVQQPMYPGQPMMVQQPVTYQQPMMAPQSQPVMYQQPQ